jgi:hypothetical protein
MTERVVSIDAFQACYIAIFRKNQAQVREMEKSVTIEPVAEDTRRQGTQLVIYNLDACALTALRKKEDGSNNEER